MTLTVAPPILGADAQVTATTYDGCSAFATARVTVWNDGGGLTRNPPQATVAPEDAAWLSVSSPTQAGTNLWTFLVGATPPGPTPPLSSGKVLVTSADLPGSVLEVSVGLALSPPKDLTTHFEAWLPWSFRAKVGGGDPPPQSVVLRVADGCVPPPAPGSWRSR